MSNSDRLEGVILPVPPGTPDTEARIFRVEAVLGTLKGLETLQIFAHPALSVYSDDNHLLGHARVVKRRGELVAEMALDYATEERLLVETGAEPLYAWVVGSFSLSGQKRYAVGGNGSAGLDLTVPPTPVLLVDEIIVSRCQPSKEGMAVVRPRENV